MKTSLCITFIFFTVLVNAQDPCPATKNGYVFQANRIGAFYSPRGSKFFDFHDGYFKVPYTSEKSPSTIFACSPWMGGYVNNELRLTGQTYASPRVDLFVGPLGPLSTPYENCYQFNQVWSVTRDEIEQHIQDYAMDGIIDDTLSNIFDWPAQGNSFFLKINGFDLPVDHQGGWADFADVNQNGIYEPQLGEYPIVHLKGQPQIPQLISWMVFNDQGEHLESKGMPLGVEFQLTVFGFNCKDNYVLNNTLFNNYKIINQSTDEIDSTYFGMWTDYDLGCPSDDFMGSDSIRNSEFVYNDGEDGDVGVDCSSGAITYGNYPPAQSMTYLSHPMHSFINYSRWYEGYFFPPKSPAEFYHLLSGHWPDGTSIAAHGDGYDTMNQGATTRFLYYGNPRDSMQWSEIQESKKHVDERPVSSIYLDTLKPGGIITIETAYTFHQDSSLNALDQLGIMYNNIDSLLEIVNNIGVHCQLSPTCVGKDCVWPGDFNHNGIADHFDLLYWGVALDSAGANRDGLINWTGHFADPWFLTLPDNLNAKHADGNGDGQVTIEDLERNEIHFLFTNPYYIKKDTFPLGPEISITSFPMDTNGDIRRIDIKAQMDIPNVLGMAFELEFDTSFFTINQSSFIFFPVDSDMLFFDNGEYAPNSNPILGERRYAYVKSNHLSDTIKNGFRIFRNSTGLTLKKEFTIDDLPDTIFIRLKNLIALDPNGNDLHIGSNILKVPNYLITGTADPGTNESTVFVYPNPAHQSISIETELESDVIIFNPQGQVLKKINHADIHQPIDISELSPGLYILQFLETGKAYKFVMQ
jgi:hypothetical protein